MEIDPLATLVSTGDHRTFEEWASDVEADLPLCPECGSPYCSEFVDGEEWTSDEGEGQTLVYCCEQVFESEEAAQRHPETRGMLVIERLVRVFRGYA